MSVATAMLVAAASQQALAGPIQNSMVFAYDFEQVVGSSVTDLSGNGNDGTMGSQMALSTTIAAGAPAYSTQHAHAQLSGSFRYVDSGVPLTSPTSALSFSMFYNAQGDTGSAAGQSRFLSTYTTGGIAADVMIFETYNPSGGTRGVWFRTNGQNGIASERIPDGDSTWHQIGFVYQGGATDGTVSFYFDGAPLGTSQTVSGITQVLAQAENWRVIEDHPNGGLEYFHDGFYDEAALWTRALTAAEMSALHSQGLTFLIAVPEPSSFLLLLIGLPAFLSLARRRRR